MTGAVHEQVTEYRVSPGPLAHPEGWRFALVVRWSRALGGTWMVTDGFEPPSWMAPDGRWHYDVLPDNGDWPEDWRDAYRYDLDTALAIAREAAPKQTVNGRTWEQWREHWELHEGAQS